MKKRVFGRKLGRERDSRRALIRGLMKAMISNGEMKTTKAKAKAIQPELEGLVTKAKVGGVQNRRLVYAFLGNDKKTTDKLFYEVVPAFTDRNSGFTRLVNLPARGGDAAPMVRLEWSEKVQVKDQVQEKKRTKSGGVKDKDVKANLKSRIAETDKKNKKR